MMKEFAHEGQVNHIANHKLASDCSLYAPFTIIGTSQVAFVALLEDSIQTAPSVNPGSLLLSMGLLWAFINYGWKAIVGTLTLLIYGKPKRPVGDRG